MPILFSAVANAGKFVAKYASCEGNFTEIAEEVLVKIPNRNHKMTYSHGHYLFHYIVDSEFFYFCITTKTCQRSRAFLFLNEIQRRFSPDEKNGFTAVLADEMYRYSEDYNTIVVRKGELDEVNSIGVGCSEDLLGEKILFVSNPDELSYTIVTQLNKPLQSSEIETLEDVEIIEAIEAKQNNYFYYVIVTVILILVWLVLSMLGPLSLVMVACICILVVTMFPKAKKEC